MGDVPALPGRPLPEWTRDREPPAPEALVGRMESEIRIPERLEAGVTALVGAARAGLADAARRAGERKGAFRLLEADACLTYACEVALDATDPSPLLERVLEAVVDEAEAS